MNDGGQRAQMLGKAVNVAVATLHLAESSPLLKVLFRQVEKIMERINKGRLGGVLP